MPLASSITVVVPALNEAENLEGAIRSIQRTVPRFFKDWEILIYDDGSKDATGRIADRLAKEDPHIRVTHHESPKNLGGCYRAGARSATKDFLIMIPGDNECGPTVMERVFSMAGEADIIVPYTANHHVRPWARQVLSKVFVGVVNFLAGQKLRYYNGTVLHRAELVRTYRLTTNGFGYQAEILVQLLRKGRSFREVPIEITYRPHGRSKALHPRSLLQVARFS